MIFAESKLVLRKYRELSVRYIGISGHTLFFPLFYLLPAKWKLAYNFQSSSAGLFCELVQVLPFSIEGNTKG